MNGCPSLVAIHWEVVAPSSCMSHSLSTPGMKCNYSSSFSMGYKIILHIYLTASSYIASMCLSHWTLGCLQTEQGLDLTRTYCFTNNIILAQVNCSCYTADTSHCSVEHMLDHVILHHLPLLYLMCVHM